MEEIKAIRSLWKSLDTHLDWLNFKPTKREQKIAGNKKHHKDAVLDYAHAILVLAKHL